MPSEGGKNNSQYLCITLFITLQALSVDPSMANCANLQQGATDCDGEEVGRRWTSKYGLWAGR